MADELQVNSYTTGNQSFPAIAAAAGGDFVVVWSSRQTDAVLGLLGVFAQRFAVPTATATATATATPTTSPTPAITPTATAGELYEIPTRSRGALAILAVLLLTACLAFLLPRAISRR